MGKLKALDENFNLTNKRIILRIDLNVPIQAGKVTDESRIKKVIPIIKELTNRKAKIILISHLGRPKGKIDEKLSLRPVTPILKNLLNSEVYFSEENYGPNVIDKSKKSKRKGRMAKNNKNAELLNSFYPRAYPQTYKLIKILN